jgi:GMP synthase-like glutamine amidotransferase
LKIGLLKCDTITGKLREILGDCSDAFITLFARYAPDIFFQVYDIQNGDYPDSLDECAGYLATGSRYSVYDNDPWILRFRDFVAELYRNEVKFVGICFGHQMIAEALGGKVSKSDRGWGIGGKNVRIIKKKSWMQPELDSYSLLLSHMDQVNELPEGGEALGTNEHCPNSMFTVGDHILGIQAHPEYTTAYAEALMLSRLDRIGRELVEHAQESLEEETHQDIITHWIENFFKNQ